MKQLIFDTVDAAWDGLGCDAHIDAHGVLETLTNWAQDSNHVAEDVLRFIESGELRVELETRLRERGTLDVTPDHDDAGEKSPSGPECDLRVAALYQLRREAKERKRADVKL